MFAATKSALILPPSIEYITEAFDNSNLTTYTFSNKSFGTESGRSLVIIGVHARQGSNIQASSVTIGGTSANLVTRGNAHTACTAIYAASVSGASGDVVVTFSAGADAAAIGIWAAYNLSSTTAFDSITQLSSQAPINTPSQGVVISVASVNASSANNITWTGVTERYDALFSSTRSYTGGDFTTTSAESPRAISWTPSSGTLTTSTSSASWQ